MLVCPYCTTGVSAREDPGAAGNYSRTRCECACRRLSCHDFGPDRLSDWWFEVDTDDLSLAMNLDAKGSFYYSENFQKFNMGAVQHLPLRELFVESIVSSAVAASVLES